MFPMNDGRMSALGSILRRARPRPFQNAQIPLQQGQMQAFHKEQQMQNFLHGLDRGDGPVGPGGHGPSGIIGLPPRHLMPGPGDHENFGGPVGPGHGYGGEGGQGGNDNYGDGPVGPGSKTDAQRQAALLAAIMPQAKRLYGHYANSRPGGDAMDFESWAQHQVEGFGGPLSQRYGPHHGLLRALRGNTVAQFNQHHHPRLRPHIINGGQGGGPAGM